MTKNDKVKICLVCSPGGHLYKTFRLKSWWKKYNRFWVTDPLIKKLNFPSNEKIYYGYFPVCRHPINFIKNLILAIQILSREKPELIFSTGAGIAPPFFIIGKIMGIKLVFMETFILSPEPTLSGKLIYLIADYFLIQNKKLKKIYPKALYWGKVL